MRRVGIFLGLYAAASLLDYWPVIVSDRVIVAKLQAKPFNVNIIQVYAPTSASSEEEMEHFSTNLDKAMRQCQSVRESKYNNGRLECKSKTGSLSGYSRSFWTGYKE